MHLLLTYGEESNSKCLIYNYYTISNRICSCAFAACSLCIIIAHKRVLYRFNCDAKLSAYHFCSCGG
eukprot:m.24247 g.24247  ORF g.24247 m.24247 type:complete len:67 (+) comp5635_c0_seq1:855-1055(+)